MSVTLPCPLSRCHVLTRSIVHCRLVFDPARSTPQAPFLAYNTPANRPLQEYEEHLTRLLTELDAIASDGIEAIRAERKKLNNDVQSELNRLDELRAQAWKAQHPDAEQQQASDQQKEQEAAADDAVQDKPIAIAEEEAPAEAKVESDSEPQTIEVSSEESPQEHWECGLTAMFSLRSRRSQTPLRPYCPKRSRQTKVHPLEWRP